MPITVSQDRIDEIAQADDWADPHSPQNNLTKDEAGPLLTLIEGHYQIFASMQGSFVQKVTPTGALPPGGTSMAEVQPGGVPAGAMPSVDMPAINTSSDGYVSYHDFWTDQWQTGPLNLIVQFAPGSPDGYQGGKFSNIAAFAIGLAFANTARSFKTYITRVFAMSGQQFADYTSRLPRGFDPATAAATIKSYLVICYSNALNGNAPSIFAQQPGGPIANLHPTQAQIAASNPDQPVPPVDQSGNLIPQAQFS